MKQKFKKYYKDRGLKLKPFQEELSDAILEILEKNKESLEPLQGKTFLFALIDDFLYDKY